jgi:hypothetical protein
MKKLLGFLSSIALITSTSSVAVACGSGDSRITSPTLNEDKAKEIIASLGGEFGFQYSDLFSDVDLSTAVINEINRLVSVNYDFERTNSNLDSLGLQKFEKDSFYQDQFKNLIQTTAENKLFSEFSKSVAKGIYGSIDFNMGTQFYGLNPINDVTPITVKDGDTTTTYYVKKDTPIKFNTKPWIIRGEKDSSGNPSTDTVIPEVKDLTAEYTGETSKFTIDAYKTLGADNALSEPVADVSISAKTALSLRFQDYFNNKIMVDVMTNALTMVYNQASLWRNLSNGGEKDPYIDITNPVFSKTQSWSDEILTNVKMVWVYTIQGDSKTNSNDVDTNVRKALGDLVDVDGNLKDSNAAFADGDDPEPTTSGIRAIFSKLASVTGGDTNHNEENGNDPYFGLSGYKGIVVSKDGTTIGDNPISGAAYEATVNNSNNLKDKGGIAVNGRSFVFQNSSNSNNYDVVITLPVYMMQLLGVDERIDSVNSTANIFTIDGATKDGEKSSKEIQFQRSPGADGKSFWNAWKNLGGKYDSPEINEIASDETKQTSMFQEIEYLISQDATNQDTAKRVIYTKYLDADLVYYAGLYDQIGTYITTNGEEDE